MTKQSTQANAAPHTVNRNAVTAIATAIRNGLNQVNGTGSLLTQVCEVSRRMYRGKAIHKDDVAATLDELTTRMGWKRGPSTDSRRSEFKAVLNTYHVLGEAMTAFRTRMGKCTWHDGIALARLINGGATVSQAVAKHAKRGNAKSAAPKNSGDAKKRAASSIKSVLKLPHLPRAFLSQLRDLCAEYSINV